MELTVSLRVTGARRVWAFQLPDGDMPKQFLLWWDPEHQVCPSEKKHA